MRTTIFLALLVVFCGLGVFLASPTARPSIGDLQRAYDREAADGGNKHDKDLVIVGVDCAASGATRYICQVGFKRSEENSDRVYLDAALLERQSEGWKLLRGLCRRLL